MMGCTGPFKRERGKARSRVRVVVGVTTKVCAKAMQKGPMVNRKRTVIPTILIVTHFMRLRRALQNALSHKILLALTGALYIRMLIPTPQ